MLKIWDKNKYIPILVLFKNIVPVVLIINKGLINDENNNIFWAVFIDMFFVSNRSFIYLAFDGAPVNILIKKIKLASHDTLNNL